jgi:hypothetical protein
MSQRSLNLFNVVQLKSVCDVLFIPIEGTGRGRVRGRQQEIYSAGALDGKT